MKVLLFLLKMTNFWGEKRKFNLKKMYIKEKIQLVFSSKIKVPSSARLGTITARLELEKSSLGSLLIYRYSGS